jgi:histidinol-phosphate/aromatic aminotransferase/cobyric acid decarboxylase-like protein
VILDEAYAEFVAEPLTDLATIHANVFVTRTMSKAFGLAGLRVGYGIGSATLVNAVEKVRGPYKVSITAERAAVAALREDRAWVGAYVSEIGESRERFCEALRGLGLAPLPSSANFVLVPMRNATEIARELRVLGVGVRAFSDLASRLPALQKAYGAALRITVGPWPVMCRVVDALVEAIAQCV